MRYALVDTNKHNHKLPVRQGKYIRAASEDYGEIICSIIKGYVQSQNTTRVNNNKVETGICLWTSTLGVYFPRLLTIPTLWVATIGSIVHQGVSPWLHHENEIGY